VIVQKFPEQTACFPRLAPLFPDNVHFSPTMSTFPRQRPLFPDNVHYSPTCSTFSRQNGRIFADTFLSPLRSQPSETFHFPFRDPRPTPTPRRRPEPPPDPPARRPAPGSCRPARPAIIKMIHYFPTKGPLFPDKRFIISRHGILFPDTVYYSPTKGLLFPDMVYYFPTLYTISRQKVMRYATCLCKTEQWLTHLSVLWHLRVL
jgi:hypothetical protein